ncbi:MAG: HD domain-containing protein [Erysipelotrichaceae bacterium]|nr:HD domain-containing protein [Erysipelotrichaceae bacterium]
MDFKAKHKVTWIFNLAFVLIVVIFIGSIVKTNDYNNTIHHAEFAGTTLFTQEGQTSEGINVNAVARSSTWSKLFDLYDEGLTENNYQAYTYDFTVLNNSSDAIADFTFKLTFSRDVFLASAWNGALEIHQKNDDDEISATIPDLRDFDPNDYALDFYTADGETFVSMKAGDYLVYYPSSTMNAMEIPIKAGEGTTPGFILYVHIPENIEDSVLELDYKFHRAITSEPLFWISGVGSGIWLIALIIFEITSAQIKKYTERHERDNEIITQSIETFTGFIDAKDPYTNGHSKRVALYTRAIAEELGYEGEELDRIYYIALLHDCGKIGVPDNILGKPGRLTDDEFSVIKSHTVKGGEILSHFNSIQDVDEGALYHHERYDGKGYPEGKAGEDIPFIARMICVADSFDAMNSNRVYRHKLTMDDIVAEIENNKGKQFDPKIADIMLRLIKEGRLPKEDKQATL